MQHITLNDTDAMLRLRGSLHYIWGWCADSTQDPQDITESHPHPFFCYILRQVLAELPKLASKRILQLREAVHL